MSWINHAQVPKLSTSACARLDALRPMDVPAGTPLFRPGDTVKGFVVMLSGRVDVFLSGPTGREILLYSVAPGQSCIQSTLGLMGGDTYSGEAIARSDSRMVLMPPATFHALMSEDDTFRDFVFHAFASRLQTMMHLLEQVAFIRVEARLARCLLDRAEACRVDATHAELAAMIGSAREVVSRRLDALARVGHVRLERGCVILENIHALQEIAEKDGAM